MVKIVFRQADGTEEELDADEGVSLMEAAVHGGVDGIDADCGGQLSCATCHVHVDAAWVEKLPEMGSDESDLLEYAIGRDERSRLSCQIACSALLDGLLVHVPETQH
ncbi:MAG: 2Fe-2S iron-sulfur cluster binding domain-containing protein [Sphingomonadales bacterium]|nr:MAG: 2Fe-2S iron-sulfur cluster binding domain-containing protein [Sphingomonadales bacterium]